ncbi:MAG: hypothetical protein KGK08_14025 [Acidobacteriota bacterium]|nr:hypothetical protein [Acidobacteriota bacterium]
MAAVQAAPSGCQTQPSAAPSCPLPDIPTLLKAVEAHQRAEEAAQRDYTYHSFVTSRTLDSHGQLKKSSTAEFDHFVLDGVPVRRMVRKDGKDLTPDELAKEDQRLEKEARHASERRSRADAAGKETDPTGHDEVTVSRLLELGQFLHPQRVQLNQRSAIRVDFQGDPNAHTRNHAEAVIRDMAGTAWIDEADQTLVQVDGHFVNSFKIGAGLVMNIQKDTNFHVQWRKINDEVWLPAQLNASGAARILLVDSFHGTIDVTYADYRKYRTSSRILPELNTVEQSPK